MLKRKKTPNGRMKSHSRGRQGVSKKAHPARRRFIISSKSTAGRGPARARVSRNGHNKLALAQKQAPPPQSNNAPGPQATVDLTETIKTLLHLAQENGYVTYDDINDILPDNLSPDDLDELYTKLRTLE